MRFFPVVTCLVGRVATCFEVLNIKNIDIIVIGTLNGGERNGFDYGDFVVSTRKGNGGSEKIL
jgi:hypothetical protein